MFALLALLIDHFETHEEPDDWLISALLDLLRHLLEEIRYEIDRGFEWAQTLMANFQNELVSLINSDELPPELFKAILDAIHDAKLTHSPELLEAFHGLGERMVPEAGAPPSREDFVALVQDFVDNHANDPFEMAEGLSELIRYMPEDAQNFIIGEFLSADVDGVIDAVALLALNPQSWIRDKVLRWLLSNAGDVTPNILRRLIVIRNWLPEQGKNILDQVTRSARKKGVVCAQWADGETIETIQASKIDGAGSQSLMISTKVGRKYRLSSILVKQESGIADIWSTPIISKQEVSSILKQAKQEIALAEISQTHLDRIIGHHIYVGLDGGKPPEAGLLQVAETIRATEWLARPVDFEQLITEMIAEAGTKKPAPDPEETILRTSAVWGNIPDLVDSWFVESQDVATFIQTTRIRKKERLIDKILQDFCEPDRRAWAEKMVWSALWFNEQSATSRQKFDLGHNFAVLAKALYIGYALKKIPFMQKIAQRTFDAGKKQ